MTKIGGLDAPVTLWLEGITPSAAPGDLMVVVTATNGVIVSNGLARATDSVRVTVIQADVDVDTDNDNGFEAPERNRAEDEYEDVADTSTRPGKILCVNDNDDDQDGIPDYADGYDLLPADTHDNATAGERFVPVVFTISDGIDPTRASVRVTYPASDPGAVTTNGAGGYTLPSGTLRLWKRDGGDGTRSTNTVANGGDFLPTATACTAVEFGFTNGLRTVTYYIEAIRTSDTVADIRILFEVDANAVNCPPPGLVAADAVRLTAVQMEFIIPDENGGKLPTRFVPVSDPRPVVTLAELTAEDVEIANGIATFTLSGAVADAIADNIPNHLADIETIRVLVDGEEVVVPTALAAGDGGAVSFWRRHPFKGLFADLEVSVPAEGVHVVTVETSDNAAGSRGQDSIEVTFTYEEERFFGRTNFVAAIYIGTNLTNTVANMILYDDGHGEYPEFVETAADSLVFTGCMDEVGIEIAISGFSGLTTNVDMFTAAMCYNISTNYQPVYSNTFVETSATSGLFQSSSAMVLNRGDLMVTVTPLNGTCQGSYVPFTERIKGPPDLFGTGDYTLEFMSDTFELEAEDGWFYPKGGSPLLAVVVPPAPDDPDICEIVYYEPNQGHWKKAEPSEWGLAPKLMKKDIEKYLAERHIAIFDIDLKDEETVIDHQGYAYIRATPQMPQLTSSINIPVHGEANWRLYIEYMRPDRGTRLGDKTYFPGPTPNVWTNVTATVKWDIAKEFGEAFRGGKAILYCEYRGVRCQKIFHIRGYNPTEAAAKAYLDANGPWYAYCIAKHESGTQSGRTYLQFNENGTRGPNPADYQYCPNRHADAGGTYGWGMMMLTRINLPGTTTYRSPDNGCPWAKELWSWKANCDTGIAVLARKLEESRASTGSLPPLPNIEVCGIGFTNGTARTPEHLDVIKRYNSGKFWSYREGRWRHVPLDANEYTVKVLNEY